MTGHRPPIRRQGATTLGRPGSHRGGRGSLVSACLVKTCLVSACLVSAFVLAGLAAGGARAAGPTLSVDSTPITARVQSACFSDNIRVTGWLLPRAETAVVAGLEGYRVSEILVKEGDAVAGDQEVVRLQRLGADQPGQPQMPGPGGRPLPNVISLKAPAAGIVSRVNARVGTLSGPTSEPVVRLVTDPDFDLLVEVPSLYASRIRVGAAARIMLADGSEVPGKVRLPAAEVDPATQFARARLAVSADRNLRFGAFARAVIDTARSCGPSVPRSAILRQNDATSVQVMRDGRLETRRVRVGLSSAESVEIREGLAEGESVVVNAGLAY